MTDGTHRDLSESHRVRLEGLIESVAAGLHLKGQSLAIAREAMINAFDAEAERLGVGE